MVALFFEHVPGNIMREPDTRKASDSIRVKSLHGSSRPSSLTVLFTIWLTLEIECLSLPVEVLPILDVVHLGNELLLVAVRGVQTIIALRDQALEVIVGLFNLVDVDFLEADHL